MDIKKILLMILFLLLLSVFIFFIMTIHSFLSPNQPVKGEVLVIEGWLSPFSLNQVKDVFENGDYKYIIVVWQQKSDADKAAAILKNSGIDENRIILIPSVYTEKHRTFISAMVVQKWVEKNDPEITSMDVFSVTVHARKSHILYKKAFGREIKIGIFASETDVYDAKFWFLSGKGIYLVLRNIGGLFYALFVDKDEVIRFIDS